MALLTDEHRAWIGRSEPGVTVDISRRDIQKYAAATQQQQQKYLDGDEAPPMFIFNLFSRVSQLHELRDDGLADLVFGPELPLPRVMAGGSELTCHRPIRAGDRLTGTRRIVDMFEKQGNTGPLIFTVTELAVTDADGKPVMEERLTRISR